MFYAHLLSVGEVSALRLFFISMTVLQHLVVSILPKLEWTHQNDLVSVGFAINAEKSSFNPKTNGKWLGTIIDSIQMTFTVPSEKINKLLADIKNILMQNVLTPKQLAKITGQLSSMHLAIGPLVRLFKRKVYHEIENRVSWYEPKIISKETKGV